VVVDDSAFARKVLREVLSADPRLEVVGIARDGLDALERIAELQPDVVTLDLVMPELDGVGVLQALRAAGNAPPVVVVTTSASESLVGLAALDAGAFELVQKPTALATDRLYELDKPLVEAVVAAARSSAARGRGDATPGASTAPRAQAAGPGGLPAVVRPTRGSTRLVVLGASTGGPRAITGLLASLPADFPVPIAIVVHMPVGYTDTFAARLDAGSPLRVVEASEGTTFEPGKVVLARAGLHLRVRKRAGGLHAVLDATMDASLHRPSVDALFESAAAAVGPDVLGVVLTGMGNDGLLGARAIRAAGGALLVEAESSCVVYGMPRAIAEDGIGAESAPLEAMAQAILDRL